MWTKLGRFNKLKLCRFELMWHLMDMSIPSMDGMVEIQMIGNVRDVDQSLKTLGNKIKIISNFKSVNCILIKNL